LYRRTKIFATIGPSSSSEGVLRRLLLYVNGVRINFSHGTEKEWRAWVKMIKRLENQNSLLITYIGDLQGPSVRIGKIHAPVKLMPGTKIKLILGYKPSSEGIPVPHEEFFDRVEVNDMILADDGRIRLRVVKQGRKEVLAEPLSGGKLSEGKALVIKDKEYRIEAPTEKDVRCIELVAKMDLDILAISYVREADDVRKVRKVAEGYGFRGMILAKIEVPSAVKNLKEIVKEADYIMVARGDLGLHFGLEVVPQLQERIVDMTLSMGKPIMIATQILESMIYSNTPTRAEVNDIYTAVREGVDSLLLTGETAIGRYPVRAVKWLDRIVRTADTNVKVHVIALDVRDRFAEGIVTLAEDLGARLIIYTMSGKTGFRIAKYRPGVSAFIGTPHEKVARMLNALWGLKPLRIPAKTYAQGIQNTIEKALNEGLLNKGDIVIATYGLQATKKHFVELLTL